MYIVANWRIRSILHNCRYNNTPVFYIDSNYVKANLRNVKLIRSYNVILCKISQKPSY